MFKPNLADTRTEYLRTVDELRRNESQWTAFESTGNYVVLAGPGSGKTKLLTTKLARILAEDVEAPRGVACITYSRECARELQNRLGRLGVRQRPDVFVGTIHGFCLRHILEPFKHVAEHEEPSTIQVAGTARRDTALQRALDETLDYQEVASWYGLRLAKQRCTLLPRSDAGWHLRDPEAARVVERYEQILHQDGYVDFDDLILMGLRLTDEHDWVKKAVRAKFPVFAIDEYQDLGALLHRLVTCLVDQAGVRVFAVGDPDQSIYGFAGADPSLLEELGSRRDFGCTRLGLNYRSRRSIVSGSVTVLREPREYEAVSNDEGVIEFVECPGGLDEQASVAFEQIVPRLLGGPTQRRLGDIALLYPDRNVGDILATQAKDVNIPYIRTDQGAAYPRTPLTRWLEDCASWCAGGWREAQPTLRQITYWWANRAIQGGSPQAQRLAINELVGFLRKRLDPSISVRDWLADFHSLILVEALCRSPESESDEEDLDRLKAVTGSDQPLGEWSIRDFGGQRGSPDHLNLMTLHSSKGMEFDVVVMVGMDEGLLPRWSQKSAGELAEARRLFYVGMTRARHEVYMTYSGFTISRAGHRFDNGPSRFLLELQERVAAGQ